MNDEYNERGFFKELILALWVAVLWCEMQVIRAWRSEWCWWALMGTLFAVAAWFLKLVVIK